MAWILVLGAGREQIPLIKAIQHEGHKVAAVDRDPDAAGVGLCDAFRAFSNRDAINAVAFGRWVGAHGVMAAASEVPDVLARVAHELDLPGISVATGLTCKDKWLYKRVLAAAGVPHTECVVVHEGCATRVFHDLGGSVVVKPQRGSGSRGVTLVTNPMALVPALRDAQEVCLDVLMERYVPGPQVSSETLIWDGRAVTAAFVDRLYQGGTDRFVEIGGANPSRWERLRDASNQIVLAAARALGIRRGTLKCDLALTREGPKIIELTPRMSGGALFSIVRDSEGVDYARQAVRIALGLEPDWVALKSKRAERVARTNEGIDMEWYEAQAFVGAILT